MYVCTTCMPDALRRQYQIPLGVRYSFELGIEPGRAASTLNH